MSNSEPPWKSDAEKKKTKFPLSISWLKEKLKAPDIDAFASQRLLEIETENHANLDDTERKLFDLPDSGWNKLPSIAYTQALNELFEFLGNRRLSSWKELKNKQREKAAYNHALTEVAGLRSEIIDLKSLITTSERVMAAWMVGAVLLFSKDIIPSELILLLPLLFSFFGFIRFREFQRNAFTLDCYLREIEVALRPDGGWVSYFFKTRRMELFFETRQLFWKAAIAASFIILLMGIFGIIEPKPFAVRVLE